MKIYNTLAKKVEDFAPLDGETAKIYSCGPTVYNHAHIGNMSAYIFADTLRRAVRLSGFETKHVMNFTDVDDKTIRDSAKKFPDLPPMEALAKLTRHYEDVFVREMREVGNDVDTLTFVRATESINEMQNLIVELVTSGNGYVADDGVYFDIAKYRETRKYGQISQIEMATETKSRIDNDEYDKDSAQDFALWKKQKPGEPAWDFAIEGEDLRGRPGWHIECSAMSVSQLGQPFDIHTGGIDLIFPHHENEIAQSTAGRQHKMYAKFFAHNEHLLVDGTKMAKSKNNFYTLPDIIERGFDPLDFRTLILQSHYRSATNFSWDNLEAAKSRLRNWRAVAELRHQTPDVADDGQAEIVNNLIDKATDALRNDLDTPRTLMFIDQAMDVVAKDVTNVNHFALGVLVGFVDEFLGLELVAKTPDITTEQKEILIARQNARDAKDFAMSDTFRDNLSTDDIMVRDTPSGQIWSRS